MLITLDPEINDRGSRYAVSGAPIASQDEAKQVLKNLKRSKKFARATHNTWAAILEGGPVKNDDGEAGAGMVIVRMLEREGLSYHMVIVTRWFGAIGPVCNPDRFNSASISSGAQRSFSASSQSWMNPADTVVKETGS